MFGQPLDFYLSFIAFFTLLAISVAMLWPRYPEKEDDFQIIEGIGPKIEKILKVEKVRSYRQLSRLSPKKIKKILHQYELNTKLHNPKTWPKQARLASQKKWKKLEKYKTFLIAGREEV